MKTPNKLLKECKTDNVFFYNADIIHYFNYKEGILSLPFDDVDIIFDHQGVISLVTLTQKTPDLITAFVGRAYLEEGCSHIDIDSEMEIRIFNDPKFNIEVFWKKVSPALSRLIGADPRVEEDSLKQTVDNITSFCLALQEKDVVLGCREITFKTAKKRYSSKNITYVASKRYISRLKGAVNIEWTHSFSVCGHWRKVKSVGKNRAGEYCINGATWVLPHKKNKHLHEKNKIRILT